MNGMRAPPGWPRIDDRLTLPHGRPPGFSVVVGATASPATILRILRNEKYACTWTWNKTETRRDPRSGRRRQFPKVATEWITSRDELLRIVPQELWERAQERIATVHKSWPGGKGKRGFHGHQQSCVAVYPQELLSGAMECACCGAAIVKVSGRSGGYYGCLGAKKGACTNKLIVRRTVAEKVILGAVREKLATPENISYSFCTPSHSRRVQMQGGRGPRSEAYSPVRRSDLDRSPTPQMRPYRARGGGGDGSRTRVPKSSARTSTGLSGVFISRPVSYPPAGKIDRPNPI